MLSKNAKKLEKYFIECLKIDLPHTTINLSHITVLEDEIMKDLNLSEIDFKNSYEEIKKFTNDIGFEVKKERKLI